MDQNKETPEPGWGDWAHHMPLLPADRLPIWRPERTVDYLPELHCRYGSRH